jgi:cytidyltransferase-like protein
VIYRFSQLSEYKKWAKNRKIVCVTGCFDLLHDGHLAHIFEASKLGGELVVGVVSDEFIRRFKGREPIHTQYKRAKILAALKPVSAVIMLSFVDKNNKLETSLHFLRHARPQVFFRRGYAKFYNTIKDFYLKEIVLGSEVLCCISSHQLAGRYRQDQNLFPY